MKKNHTLRLWILLAIALVVALIVIVPNYIASDSGPSDSQTKGGAASSGGARAATRALQVTVSPVVSERILDGIRSVGTLKPFEQVELAAETSGKVVEILFKEGAQVSKGQALLKINDDDLQAQLKRYEFQEKTLAEKLERQRVLFAREAISQESFDAVQTEYNVLKADMELLQVKISRCTVRAPFSGVVGFRSVSDGAYISPGMPITTLVDLSRLRIEFSIPEKYNTMKLEGMKIYFTTEGSAEQNTAMIYAAEPVVDKNTLSIVLRAMYENRGMRLRPGMSARVVIPTTALMERMLVPTESIVPSMEGKSVWIVRGGKAASVRVETGVRLEKMIEVTRGLSIGDSVITTGLMQIRDGVSVEVSN